MRKRGIYSGTVVALVYESEDFRIVKLRLDTGGMSVTAKGDFYAQTVRIGSWVSFEGRWEEHSQYGRQLQVLRSPICLPHWTDESVLAALTAHGVGPTLRMKLRVHAIETDLSLKELLDSGNLSGSDLDPDHQDHILSRWRALRTYMDATMFLEEVGIPPKAVGPLMKRFGNELSQRLTEDPWILVRLAGLTFEQADGVALRLGVSLDSPKRMEGAVLSILQDLTRQGHVFGTVGQLKYETLKLFPDTFTAEKLANAIRALAGDNQVIVDSKTRPGIFAIYLPWFHEMEQTCVEEIQDRMSNPPRAEELVQALSIFLYEGPPQLTDHENEPDFTPEFLARLALQSWARGNSLALSDSQMQAAVLSIISPIFILTGLPGTGKTTTLRAVVTVLKEAGVRFTLVAPTGIAAKRMSSLAGHPAYTVHRAFGAAGHRKDDDREAGYTGVKGARRPADPRMKKGGKDWEFGPDNLHPSQVIIVDETSMLDLHLLYRILSGTRSDCRIVFVGDPFQLPSVGAGDVLRDMAKSDVFPHVHLDEIFRQDEASGIVLAAHSINAGKTPAKNLPDFNMIREAREKHAAERIVEIAEHLYAARINFQVLSPRHGGDVGVTALNEALRRRLNPALPGLVDIRLGGDVVREDDRVMVTRNDYQREVYNGDVGKISMIDRRAREVSVKVFEPPGVPDRIVRFPFSGPDGASRTLRLAYAQTVHKSQGQEYDVIVVPVLRSFGRQLQRNLFYTAITRARKKVFLVGTWDAFSRAVQNNTAEERNSLLRDHLSKIVTVSGLISEA